MTTIQWSDGAPIYRQLKERVVAMMLDGVRPIIRFASAPIARTRFVRASIATTDGSLMTMPRSRT